MKNYVILIKGGQGVNWKKLDKDARADCMRTWRLWLNELRKEGKLVIGSPLLSDGELLYESGQSELVPENYDMAADMITGFCVVKAEEFSDARIVADECPLLVGKFTSCEIRECKAYM